MQGSTYDLESSHAKEEFKSKPEKKFEEVVLNDKCGRIHAVSIMPRKRAVFAIRDFPVNCGPVNGLPFQGLDNSMMRGSTDDLKSTQVEGEFESKPETKDEVLPSFWQDTFAEARFLSSSKTSFCGTTKPANAVQQIAAKVPPPWKRISANRTFPPGCGRKTLQDENQVAPDFTIPETCGLHQKITGQKTREAGQQKTISLNMEEKMQQKDNKCLDGKLSKHISKISSPKMIPASLELPRHQVIVHALMAAPNCPWRNGKRGQVKLNKF